jgi:ABC-type nickel/cobalt efflux system permease component RcnA
VKPGLAQAAIAIGVGLAAGLVGATIAVATQAPEGMRGIAAGLLAALGAILTWRGFGGTRQDVRDLFR